MHRETDMDMSTLQFLVEVTTLFLLKDLFLDLIWSELNVIYGKVR